MNGSCTLSGSDNFSNNHDSRVPKWSFSLPNFLALSFLETKPILQLVELDGFLKLMSPLCLSVLCFDWTLLSLTQWLLEWIEMQSLYPHRRVSAWMNCEKDSLRNCPNDREGKQQPHIVFCYGILLNCIDSWRACLSLSCFYNSKTSTLFSLQQSQQKSYRDT